MLKYKKYFSILLIFCLMFTIFVQPSHAIFGIDDYILCQALILAGVAVTSGVVYTNVKDLVYENLCENASLIQNLNSKVTNGVMIWTLPLWGIIKGSLNNILNAGSNDITKPVAMMPITNQQVIGNYYQTLVCNYGTYYWVWDGIPGHNCRYTSNFNVPVNGVYGFSVTSDNKLIFKYINTSDQVATKVLSSGSTIVTQAKEAEIPVEVTCTPDIDNPEQKFISTYIPEDKTEETTQTYGKMVTSVPSDILDGTRSVSQAMEEDLYNKTKEDIQSMPLSTTDIINPELDTGTISGVINSIDRFFDLTNPINLEPLKMLGTEFTSKFPFSLPWDFLNSFTLFATENTFSGEFEISLMGEEIPVSLNLFADYINVIKLVELVIFDIGLIFTTRRLLGGAS